MSKKSFLFMITILICMLLPGIVFSATEEQKQASIDSGLSWLASTQDVSGRWNNGDVYNNTASTGAALLAFLEEGYTAGTDVEIGGVNYGDVVGNGLNYLFSQASIVDISPQTAGNPDSNNDGVGAKFVLGGANGRDTYVTGLVLPAIAKTGTPNAVVTNGALAGWTYEQVVQNTVDYFAYGQEDSGTARGGWRYSANSGQSDNSTAQWPVMGSLFATEMGVEAPQFMKNELKVWIDYIQYTNGSGTGIDGSSGYNSPTYLNNESKTGGLLVEMAYAEENLAGDSYDLTNPDVLAALAYLNREWDDSASGWNGNFGHPYAMWSIYKGLELTIGLDDTTYINNFFYNSDEVTLDDGDTYTWWEDYCEWLVQNQNLTGVWNGYSYWTGAMATAWNINILAATQIPGDDDNKPVPEPSTLLLLGSGLIGLLGYSRRRKKDKE